MADNEKDLEDAIYGERPPASPQQTHRAVGEDPAPEPEEEPQASPEPPPLKAFPERHKEALTGLMFLGRLEEEFEWLGHKFVIRTRTAGEQIECGVLIQPTVGTRLEMKAWEASVVAASVVSVDGMPIITPVDLSRTPTLRERYDYVITNWYPPVIDAVYERAYALEQEMRAVVAAMGEA